MEGRRVPASPLPFKEGRRRVFANKKRPRPDAHVNTFNKLLRREIWSKHSFPVSNAPEKFRNMRLLEEYDSHDPKGHCPVALPFLMKRTKIIEIVAAQDIVFALAHSGVCTAFSRGL